MKNKDIEIVFNPPLSEQKAGVVSYIDWQWPKLKKTLCELFGENSAQQIERIEITPKGLRAVYK